MSEHPDLTAKHVRQYPRFPWRTREVFKHPNISPTSNPNCSDYSVFVLNPSLDPEFVLQHSETRWGAQSLFMNPMTLGKRRWMERKRLEIIKTLQIQRYWRMCTSNSVMEGIYLPQTQTASGRWWYKHSGDEALMFWGYVPHVGAATT